MHKWNCHQWMVIFKTTYKFEPCLPHDVIRILDITRPKCKWQAFLCQCFFFGYNSKWRVSLLCGSKQKLNKVKVRKYHPVACHEDTEWQQSYSSTFFNLDAAWAWVVKTRPRPLYLREWPGNHCIGSRKISPSQGFDPWTVQHCTRVT